MDTSSSRDEVTDIELKAERIQLFNEVNVLEGVPLEHGQIVIDGNRAVAIPAVPESSGVNTSSGSISQGQILMNENNPPSPPFTKGGSIGNPALEKGDDGGFSGEKKSKVKPIQDSSYKGVSIADTSGKSISSSMVVTKPKNMKRVENLGKPKGEVAKAQSVKSVLRDTESEELKTLEEKRLKRKDNFKKALEERRARKALTNR